MFEKLSKFFGAKNKSELPTQDVNDLLKNQDFGGIVLAVAKDKEALAKMTEGEISEMMYAWECDLYDFNRRTGFLDKLSDAIPNIKKLDGLTVDLGGITEISRYDFKVKGVETNNDLKITINKTENPDVDTLEVYSKGKAVLGLDINYMYDDVTPATEIMHILPGKWLGEFINYLSKTLDENIDLSNETQKHNDKLKVIEDYNAAVSELTNESINSEIKLQVSKSTEGLNFEDAYQLAVLNTNQWKETLGECLNSNNLTVSSFISLRHHNSDEVLVNYMTAKGFDSIKFVDRGIEYILKNPLGGDGTEITIEEEYASGFDALISVKSGGKEVLKLRESYDNNYDRESKLEVIHFLPGKWLESVGSLLSGDLSKINERAVNLKNTGRDITRREIASEMFDL